MNLKWVEHKAYFIFAENQRFWHNCIFLVFYTMATWCAGIAWFSLGFPLYRGHLHFWFVEVVALLLRSKWYLQHQGQRLIDCNAVQNGTKRAACEHFEGQHTMRQRALYKGHVVHWQEPTLAKASRLFYCVQWPVLVCRVNPSERQVNSTKIQLIGGPPDVVASDGRVGRPTRRTNKPAIH